MPERVEADLDPQLPTTARLDFHQREIILRLDPALERRPMIREAGAPIAAHPLGREFARRLEKFTVALHAPLREIKAFRNFLGTVARASRRDHAEAQIFTVSFHGP